MDLKQISRDLRKTISELENYAKVLEELANANNLSGKQIRVGDLRCIGILERISSFPNSKVTIDELRTICSDFGRKYRTIAGYMGGKRPSIKISGVDNEFRELTEHGKTIIEEYRGKWGHHWLSNLDLGDVKNAPSEESLFIIKSE